MTLWGYHPTLTIPLMKSMDLQIKSTFRSQFDLPDYPFSICADDQILTIGSCFAQHLGSRLSRTKFDVLTNPFGIVFNPISVSEVLLHGLCQRSLKDLVVVQNDGLWHSLAHHGRFSATSQEVLLQQVELECRALIQRLRSVRVIILTFGTAHVYRHVKSNQIAANCHKMPAQAFHQERLEVQQVVDALSRPFSILAKRENPPHIMLSVSPVRYWKDGAHESQLSKATLQLALATLVDLWPQCHYFPAYELLLDDLRDYRFYATDMFHPNELAIDYIYDRFTEALLSDTARQYADRMIQLVRALEHRPLHPDAPAYRRFVDGLVRQFQTLKRDYPAVDFSKEAKMLSALEGAVD